MKSTIVIPSYNGIHYLEDCLKSLKKENAHIVVIDNGSTDGTFDIEISGSGSYFFFSQYVFLQSGKRRHCSGGNEICYFSE